jgi:hypothetical protein
MSNPQTAEEWKTVAANASAQIKDLTAQQATATASETAAVAAAQAEYDRLRAFSNNPKNFDLKTPEGIASFKAAKAEAKSFNDNQLNSARIAEENAQQQFTSQINQLRQTQSNADRQASAALAGPPQTSSNTPPATDKPNTDPTTVTTTVVPNPSVTDPPPPAVGDEALQATEDAQAAALAAQEGRAFAPPAVDPNSDPNTNVGSDGPSQAELLRNQNAQAVASDPNTNVGSDGPSQAELLRNQNAQAVASDPNTNVGNETANPNFAANPDEEAERTNLNAAIKQGTLDKARAQNTIANQRRNPNNGDWRVKLRLAPGSTYLYNAPGGSGILQPLAAQGGVIFPYTPTIATTYKATYSSYDLTHSNYKGYYYQGSQVEPVTLSCPFTAQSTVEAEYLLAVIHFFRSVTKMFYGQDPERGTPPPLVYLTGLGEFQFNEHPCVVQSFTYELPADVDYIRARSQNVNNSNMLNKRQASNATGPGTTWGGGILGNVLGGAVNRLFNAGLPKGGMNKPPAPASFGQNSPTYVPTKMTISISLLPIQSRKQQSQQFSLRQYANGDLLKGGFW